MKASIKIDFEKWLITQMSKDAIGNYFTYDGKKVYVWFEGQTIKPTDYYITLQIWANDTQRVATKTIYHAGTYRFYIYANPVIMADKISDFLASMLNEKIIDINGAFRIETGILKTHQRGNKFAGMDYFENICDIKFEHWENIPTA